MLQYFGDFAGEQAAFDGQQRDIKDRLTWKVSQLWVLFLWTQATKLNEDDI